MEDYARRVKELSRNSQMRQQQGPSWTCWCCQLSYPAAGFNADVSKPVQVYENCVAPGHWRRCNACEDAVGLARDIVPTRPEVQCASCMKYQIAELFEEGATTCNGCLLRESFMLFCCNTCGDFKARKDVFQLSEKEAEYCCFTCAPELCFLDCTVCRKQRPSGDFRGHPRAVRQQTVHRCTWCSQCEVCSEHIQDFRKFVCNTRTCVRCARKHTCTECKQIQKSHDFPEDVARHPARYGPGKTPLVCTICREKAVMKECNECRTQKPLHAFPEDVARNPARYGPGKTQLLCNSC